MPNDMTSCSNHPKGVMKAHILGVHGHLMVALHQVNFAEDAATMEVRRAVKSWMFDNNQE